MSLEAEIIELREMYPLQHLTISFVHSFRSKESINRYFICLFNRYLQLHKVKGAE